MERVALTIVLALAATVASAQPYAISWSTVDGGGTMSAAGGTFTLAATAGQPDAGGPFAGGPYTVHGGFWAFAAGAVTPQADLSITKTDGQATAVPGQAVTYTVVAANAGPVAVTGATVSDTPPATITGVTWTCTASPGSSCPPSGSGAINAPVSLPVGGSATFTLTGAIDPAATGTLANTAAVTAPSGVTDPSAANNAATDTDTLTPLADLALTLSDLPDPVGPGGALTYQVQVGSSGPSVSPGMTVTHTLPGAVSFVSSTPGAPACSHFAGVVTCTLGGLAPAANTAITVQTTVSPTATGTLASSAVVVGNAVDPVAANNADGESTAVLLDRPQAEAAHGTRLVGDLAAAGGVADVDLFRLRQDPYASYEVVVDAASGDLGAGAGPGLDRVASDGSTVVQSSVPVGAGASRSLRFANATSSAIENQLVRVRSLGCGSDCGGDDTYRLRAWETTMTVPRFNNSGSQVTVLLLQNPTDQPVTAALFFWSPSGALLATHTLPVPLAPKSLLVLGTAGLPALAGTSGSITVVHDAPYGALAGKTVALEPATGFSFDSPMQPRPR
jgi:uncharacterized repeat protein (TIGR01451 family)